jgi:hypothetical protein
VWEHVAEGERREETRSVFSISCGWVDGWDSADVWVRRGYRWVGTPCAGEKSSAFLVLHSPSTLSTSKNIRRVGPM